MKFNFYFLKNINFKGAPDVLTAFTAGLFLLNFIKLIFIFLA